MKSKLSGVHEVIRPFASFRHTFSFLSRSQLSLGGKLEGLYELLRHLSEFINF